MRAVWVVEVLGRGGVNWYSLSPHLTREQARLGLAWRRRGSSRKFRVVKYVPAPAKKPAKGGPRGR